MFKIINVGIRVTAKASLKDATVTALLKELTLFTPSLDVARDQLLGRRWCPEGHYAGDEVHWPTQHQGGRGLLLAADPAFVVTYRAEELFEVFSRTKKARRLMRARGVIRKKETNGQENDLVQKDTYREQLEVINDIQLSFESLGSRIKALKDHFSRADTLVTNIRSMDAYLNALVDEYENMLPQFDAASFELPLNGLPNLYDLIRPEYDETQLRTQCVEPYKEVLQLIQRDIMLVETWYPAMNFLEVRRLCSGYGKKQVLFDLSFSARTGEISAIIGPNGSGKSTALKAIFGVPPVWQGEIRVKGRLVSGWRPLEGITNGMALVPQGNRVFNDLSLLENLEIGGLHLAHRKRRESIRMVMRLFPWLGRRSREAAGRLSGGEQQMVAISRALVSQPEALLLDEPSLGLSPGKVKTVFAQISRLNAELGTTILIVEQRVRAVLQLAQAVHALKLGRCVYSGNASALLQDSDRLKSIFL